MSTDQALLVSQLAGAVTTAGCLFAAWFITHMRGKVRDLIARKDEYIDRLVASASDQINSRDAMIDSLTRENIAFRKRLGDPVP